MYLLDTHSLLWFLFNNPNLSKNAQTAISSKEKIFVSIVTLWEIAIKRSIRKLDIDYTTAGLKELCLKEKFEILSLSEKHIDLIHDMPFFHNDPFDRILIAQAQAENLTIITKDSKFKFYDVKILW